jgi:hypothetical protein
MLSVPIHSMSLKLSMAALLQTKPMLMTLANALHRLCLPIREQAAFALFIHTMAAFVPAPSRTGQHTGNQALAMES